MSYSVSYPEILNYRSEFHHLITLLSIFVFRPQGYTAIFRKDLYNIFAKWNPRLAEFEV
jgi:hypothetical protein